MSASRTRFATALLSFALIGPAGTYASTAPPIPARALVDSIAARYAALDTYHFTGVSHMTMTPDGGGAPLVNGDTPFVFATAGPSRTHNEILNPSQPVVFVADGESLAVYAPGLGQFVVRPAPRIVRGQPSGGEFAGALQPFVGLMRLATGISGARNVGTDTVITAAGSVLCRKLLLDYAPDSSSDGVTMLPRTLWVDPARLLVLRDDVALRVERQGQGSLTSRQSMRFVIADVTSGGPDSLYRIAPRPGMHRVTSLGPPPPPPPAIVGKPAPDFTLPLLTTGAKVKLSSLRGKVVVLDFWATWCGPCRRWMPIVAKLEKELKGRDVRFFAINQRDPADKVREFLKATGVTVPVLLDLEGASGMAYDASSIPLTVIVGRDGKVVDALLGLHPEEDLRAALRSAGVQGL
jgi:thiol-disulfide isomerase/thioredoxin